MSRLKRTSKQVAKATTRASALATIDPNLDLGNDITLAAYQKDISDTQKILNTYNSRLAETDSLLKQLGIAEKELDDLSERMLAAVAVKFGRDSIEYGKAGGTRKSTRKRPTRNGSAAKNGNGHAPATVVAPART